MEKHAQGEWSSYWLELREEAKQSRQLWTYIILKAVCLWVKIGWSYVQRHLLPTVPLRFPFTIKYKLRNDTSLKHTKELDIKPCKPFKPCITYFTFFPSYFQNGHDQSERLIVSLDWCFDEGNLSATLRQYFNYLCPQTPNDSDISLLSVCYTTCYITKTLICSPLITGNIRISIYLPRDTL